MRGTFTTEGGRTVIRDGMYDATPTTEKSSWLPYYLFGDQAVNGRRR
ncbi:hypothetical protein [Mycobacterium camsae]|nr:hypothetical protein [Mycobacterium gordonae]